MPLLTSFLASAPGTTTLNATQVLQEILQDCLEKFLHYKTSALPGLSHVPLLLHAVYVVAHVLSCLYYVGTKSLNTYIQGILQDCLKNFCTGRPSPIESH